MSNTPSYPDWKAPSQDGEVLLWPNASELTAQTHENRSRLSAADDVRIQNTPLPHLRRAARAFINHPVDQPLVATGHQTELYHPGVWVKDVLINQLAGKVNGQAFHFAVDTDGPKHLNVRWPGFSAPISDDPKLSSRAWSALVAPPTPKHLESIERSAREASAPLSYGPLIFDFLNSLRRLSLEPDEFPAMLTNAQHELDWKLGLRHHALTMSGVLRSDSFLAFAHHVMARADEFAAIYNAALQEYRRSAGIKSETRPMPDLFVSEESIESPFWLDDLTAGLRARPSVFKAPGGWMLELVSGEEFLFDPALDAFEAANSLRKFLTRTNHRLSTRALTLTTFLRLIVADQFVHGIGGRYDQVSDRIIARHFGIDPPKFSVTTATLVFPGATERERVCMPCLVQQEHRLKHAVLGEKKRELVGAIASMPRKSNERETAYAEMQQLRHDLLASSDEFKAFERKFADARVRKSEESTLFDRELFYAIQPKDRLEMLIERYRTLS